MPYWVASCIKHVFVSLYLPICVYTPITMGISTHDASCVSTVYTYTRIFTCRNTCACTGDAHVCAYIHLHVYLCVFVYVYMLVYVCVYICNGKHAHRIVSQLSL